MSYFITGFVCLCPKEVFALCVQGGGGFEVSQVRLGKFVFQIGRGISHAKSRGFCECTLCYRYPARGDPIRHSLLVYHRLSSKPPEDERQVSSLVPPWV